MSSIEDTAGTALGTDRVKRGMAEMLKGGVIMDVVNAEQAGSPRTPAPSPSWPSSVSRPTSAPRAGCRA